MLSTSAFNALLKTLEEPPEHVIFILATTEPHQVPQTILSRCQRYDFRRIKPSDIILRTKEIAYGEDFHITEEAYALIARLGDGSMRDAISVLERVVSACGNSITYDNITDTLGMVPIDAQFDMAHAICECNLPEVFSVLGRVSDMGQDLNVFVDSIISHFRNLIICKVSETPESLLDYSDDEIVRFKSDARNVAYEKLSYIVESLTRAKSDAKWIKSPRVVYETAFMKMCRPELDMSQDALLARLSDMEEKLKEGIAVVPAAAPVEEKPETSIEKEKKKPSGRLYSPIPKEKLTASNPIVIVAKKWEKTVSAVIKRNPFLATALVGMEITIDDDGIILLYDRNKEKGAYNIALNKINLITQLVRKASGIDLNIKVAYKDELEDYMVDFWSITDDNSEKEENTDKDPLGNVIDKMEDFIDSVDDREFLSYKPQEDDLSQSSFDEDEREEFLDSSEIEE